MVKKVVKMPIPEEISENGGAMVRFVDQRTTALDETIKEAIEGLYVIGQEGLVKNNFFGLFKSMAAGVERDGKPRKLADFMIVGPVFKGPVDLDKGFDPKVNEVRIVARLLNEMELDITNWTFEDVTEGRKAFTIESIKAGETGGKVIIGEKIEINGHNFPKVEDLRVEYALSSGAVFTVDPALVSGDCSRVDIDGKALKDLELTGEETITFILRGNYAKASKSVPAVDGLNPRIRKVVMEGYESTPDVMKFKLDTPVTIEGENLTLKEGDKLSFELWEEGHYVEGGNLLPMITSATADKIKLSCIVIDNQMSPDGEYWGADTRFVLTRNGIRYEYKVTFHE